MGSIFLSHTWKDKEFTRKLGNRLKDYGAKVWIDEAEIKVGESLIGKIEEGINEMEYLGVVLSPDSIKSEWVKREVEIAINDEIRGKKVKVLPIVARKCQIPSFLQGKLHADFRRKKDWHNSLILVVRALGLNEEEVHKTPGNRVILVEKFIEKIRKYFSPKKVEIEFFEDMSGIDFIMVYNTDDTFQLYSYHTKPSYIDLINKIFEDKEGQRITDIDIITDSYIVPQKEIDNKSKEIKAKYNFPEDSYPAKWEDKEAVEEWEEWLKGKMAISLICE